MTKSIFGNVGTAEVKGDGNYIRPCRCWFKLAAIKIIQNRKKEDRLVIELVTLAIVGDPVEQVEEGKLPHRVNEEVCHMLKPSSDYFASEVKAIICTILDEDPVTTDPAEIEAACEAMVSIEQPLTGMVIEIDARNIVLNNNKNFTKVKYLREVPTAEVLAHVAPEVVARFFPGQVLEVKAQAEADAAAAQATV